MVRQSRMLHPPNCRGGGTIWVVIKAQFKRSHLRGYWGISAYGIGCLHIWKGTISNEKYIRDLVQHVLPPRPCLFQQDNTKLYETAQVKQRCTQCFLLFRFSNRCERVA